MDDPILTLKQSASAFRRRRPARRLARDRAAAKLTSCSARTAQASRRSSTCSAGLSGRRRRDHVRRQALSSAHPDRRLPRRHSGRASGTEHAVAHDGRRKPVVREFASTPWAGELSRDEQAGGGALGGGRSRCCADHRRQPPRRRADAANRDRQGAVLREQASHPRRADRVFDIERGRAAVRDSQAAQGQASYDPLYLAPPA